MNKLILILFFTALYSINSFSQCATCTPNPSCTTAGICDSIMDTGMVNKSYNFVASFFMPGNFTFLGTSVTLNKIRIANIVGASGSSFPIGLNWISSRANNTWYPTQGDSQGCVRFCGTPLQAGKYKLEVKLLADVIASGITVTDQAQSYFIDLVVLPDTASAAGPKMFDLSPKVYKSCTPQNYSATAKIDQNPKQITEWYWTVNGVQDNTSKKTKAISASTPGKHEVILRTVIYDYIIDSITIQSCNNSWQDASDGLWPFVGKPDLYVSMPEIPYQGVQGIPSGTPFQTTYSIYDAQNNTNPPILLTAFNKETNGNPNGVPFLALPTNKDTFNLILWDSDEGVTGGLGYDDNMGSTFFLKKLGVQVKSFNGNQVSIHIGKMINSEQFDTFAIEILSKPIVALSPAKSMDTICLNSSVTLSCNSAGNFYQWYKNDTTSIIGATSETYAVTSAGKYKAVVTNAAGCSDTTAQIQVHVIDNALAVIVPQGSNALKALDRPGNKYFQWYRDGQLINGATSNTYSPTTSGSYTLVASNNYCSHTSSAWSFTSGIFNYTINKLEIYPNPVVDVLNIKGLDNLRFENVDISIFDIVGNKVISHNNVHDLNVNVAALTRGTYLVELRNEKGIHMNKFIKE